MTERQAMVLAKLQAVPTDWSGPGTFTWCIACGKATKHMFYCQGRQRNCISKAIAAPEWQAAPPARFEVSAELAKLLRKYEGVTLD